MIDISMQGASLVIRNSMLNGAKDVVLEFSDEGTPIDFPDMETVGYAMTMNGDLVTWTKPAPVTFRVTVIPGSSNDSALRRLLYAGHIGGAQGKAINQQAVHIETAVLTVPSITNFGSNIGSGSMLRFTFKNGRMSGGQPAIGSNAEGKMSARTYNFVFESVDHSA